ncbi:MULTISPECIES: hypothetical protein [Ramlibacter]|uniref:Uncharacterized protein n=1 Tax=Ramlibacter pinisoli TaxID=2682844 RepID=A0A6N8IT35_9BURK|nr:MULTISPECIES: hypothetical protein [Ramlibacter]MBA2964917.1 hypothetical protein [Ramlibacter sp. CGMCC 1.13660]MVQ29882.1 hypothetical protein [Ramlibacter pinisoli]
MTTLSARLATALAALVCLPALAHDGHGLAGSHWHATDSAGLLLVAALAALALWFSRGGK